MDNDIRRRLKEVLILNKVTVNSISHSTAEQRRLNRQINEDATITFETISSIIENFQDIDANWLITGKGDMYKSNTAGRDNVGTGNEIAGNNTGVIGNTGTIGNVGGNHVSIGDTSNIKKIMNEEGVSIEFAQSVELLQQANAYLETRVKDLENLNASQSKTIETMQILIDTLTKK